jgi:hypothetical protein
MPDRAPFAGWATLLIAGSALARLTSFVQSERMPRRGPWRGKFGTTGKILPVSGIVSNPSIKMFCFTEAKISGLTAPSSAT